MNERLRDAPEQQGVESRSRRLETHVREHHRNVVERAFNRVKQWRGLATRYDKHALTYRGGMVLASILLWLQ